MRLSTWHEEPISKGHNRDAFDCGDGALNEFLQRYARKSHEMGGAKTFLTISDSDTKIILGYYSLSPASIAYARTPEVIRRGLARYEFPAFRLARLAVDLKVRGQALGGQLLLSASKRCLLAAAEVGGGRNAYRRQERESCRLVSELWGSPIAGCATFSAAVAQDR